MRLSRIAARLFLLAALALISACAPVVTAFVPSPSPRPLPTATAAVTVTVVVAPTTTAEGAASAVVETTSQRSWVRSSDVQTGAAIGDAIEGARLFRTFNPRAGTTCSACHRSDSEDRLIGPGLLHISIRGETRVAGLSAAAYIRQSILDPGAYVVEGYPNLMPKHWGSALSEQEVNDLIAFLISIG